jgi:hypothetical protein
MLAYMLLHQYYHCHCGRNRGTSLHCVAHLADHCKLASIFLTAWAGLQMENAGRT